MKNADLSVQLARARAVAAELASATDDLNLAIGEAERQIEDLGLGVSGAVLLEEPDEQPDLATKLHWGKIGGEWQLSVGFWHLGNCEREEPLSNASRRLRLMAWEKLPELIGVLITIAEAQLETVRRAAIGYRTALTESSAPQPGTPEFDKLVELSEMAARVIGSPQSADPLPRGEGAGAVVRRKVRGGQGRQS